MLKSMNIVWLLGRCSAKKTCSLLQRPGSCLATDVSPSVAHFTRCYKNRDADVETNFGRRFIVRHSSSSPENDVHIYNGNLTPQIRMVKIFSLCSSLAGLAAQPLLYKHASELGGTGVVIGVATFVGFFTFVTPLLLHALTKKYVTEMHHNSSTNVYTASLLTFFLRVKKVSFKVEEVDVPDVPGLFTTFKVKGISLFVDPKMFANKDHYGKLMGYDKPIDFLLKKDCDGEKKEETASQDSIKVK